MKNQETFLFGEFEGQLISEVMKTNPSYVRWALKIPNFNVELKKIFENTKIDYKKIYPILKNAQ
jgi:hypothetical protein